MSGGIPLAAAGYYPAGFRGTSSAAVVSCQRGRMAAIAEAVNYVRFEFWPAPVFRGDALTPSLAVRPMLRIAARYPQMMTTGDVLEPGNGG